MFSNIHNDMQPPPPSSFKTFSSAQNKTLFPLSIYFVPQPCTSQIPDLHQSESALWIYLLWIIHINGVIQGAFCVWLLSLSSAFKVHVLARISPSLYVYTMIFFFPLMDMHIFSSFWLLWILLLGAWLYLYLSTSFPLWGYIPRSGIYG